MLKTFTLTALLGLVVACNPTVRVEAPSEPIRIVADITIKHEIKVIVEKDVEDLLNDEELF